MSKSLEYAVVIGTYTNACSIIFGLKRINYDHEIIAIDPTVNNAKCLSEIIFPDIPVIKKRIENLDEIVALINTHIHESAKKTLFMTSEEFLEPIRIAIQNRILRNTIAYTGSKIDNDLIFDRFKFYQFVAKLGIDNIPITISSKEDPYAVFGNEFIIRVNKSWDGSKKLPRLKIIHSHEEKENAERELQEAGLTSDMWSYQELLSTVDTNNISVCGWYDEQYHQYAITRKIIQHPPKTGNGDVVEIYHNAPSSLIHQTEMILKALQYSGAFEMEFVLDENNNEYKLIELNPRFWMQHGLIEEATDYSLIRRTLGQKNIPEIAPDKLQHIYWINGTQAIYRLIKGQFNVLSYLSNGICMPSLRQAIHWLFYYHKYIRECN